MTIPVEAVIDTNDTISLADNQPFPEKLLILPHSPRTLLEEASALQGPLLL